VSVARTISAQEQDRRAQLQKTRSGCGAIMAGPRTYGNSRVFWLYQKLKQPDLKTRSASNLRGTARLGIRWTEGRPELRFSKQAQTTLPGMQMADSGQFNALPHAFRSRRRWLRVVMIPVLIGFALCVYRFDLELSQAISGVQKWPGDVRRLIAMSEYLAHGSGVAVILAGIWLLIPEKRRFVPRLAACAFGGGLGADVIKLCVARQRPIKADLSLTDIDLTWAVHAQGMATGNPGNWDYAWQSFPSAHTATAVGLAIGLSWLFPRGKYLFWGMALLAGLQRIVFLAHWPSDVIAGAAVGIVAGLVFTASAAPGNRFWDAWEKRNNRCCSDERAGDGANRSRAA
jgi:membrane-associated phospholipid phosphatase